MRGLILAAGRGSRMGGATEERPKCLCPLAGRTLLAWQRSALAAGGVEDTAIVTGYRRELLEAELDHCYHNPRWARTNMVASMLAADEWLAVDTTILSYSDIVYRPDAVRALAAAEGDLLLTYDLDWLVLWTERFDDPLSDAETFRCDEDGWLLDIGARTSSLADVQGQYMGLLRFSPEGWQQVRQAATDRSAEAQDGLDMTSLLRDMLARGIGIRCVPVRGGWCEVDSQTDLEAYERCIDTGGWSHDWRWRETDGDSK